MTERMRALLDSWWINKLGNIPGYHIVGPHAGELIHQVVHLMKANPRADFLASSIFSHPSLSESIVQCAMEVHYGPISWVKKC
jgi:dihydrolipoamide dehydrogenase